MRVEAKLDGSVGTELDQCDLDLIGTNVETLNDFCDEVQRLKG